MTKIFVVGTAVLAFVGLVGGAAIYLFGDQISIAEPPFLQEEIASFEDCVAAGNAVMESYPRQCRTADGKHFVEDIGNELEKTDLIRVSSPRPNQEITSPLHIEGEARGFWFFEADFPVRLLGEQGNEIAVAVATAQAEWMTEDFVPFEANLEFTKPEAEKGTLVFERDNSSDLPENDDELRMPILFGESSESLGEGNCIVTGCSGQICADEEVFTTCEFLPEYACYQQATCERQPNGECGWTQTEELMQCLGVEPASF